MGTRFRIDDRLRDVFPGVLFIRLTCEFGAKLTLLFLLVTILPCNWRVVTETSSPLSPVSLSVVTAVSDFMVTSAIAFCSSSSTCSFNWPGLAASGVNLNAAVASFCSFGVLTIQTDCGFGVFLADRRTGVKTTSCTSSFSYKR